VTTLKVLKHKQTDLAGIRQFAKDLKQRRQVEKTLGPRLSVLLDVVPKGMLPLSPPPVNPIWKLNSAEKTTNGGSPELTIFHAALKALREMDRKE
jgi:hypothetical protein